MRIPATLHARRYAAGTGDDALYHALVHEGGGAAAKALLTTPVSDRELAARLRELGAKDGGGVPMAAWNLRRLPLVRAPETRVSGSPMTLLVEWGGWSSPRRLDQLVQDPGGQGLALRFGGNEEHDHHWESGCVVCLYSCPGGVISNAQYTLRDYVRGATRFLPAPDLPPDGTEVTITLGLE
ncbi:MAG: YdjY domain-containing protein [Gemmatimonadota bacterium]